MTVQVNGQVNGQPNGGAGASELVEATVDEVAAALREDPVLVPQMFGNGRTDDVREGFQAIVDEADFPVYVVMVPRITDVSGDEAVREAATLLHSRLGGGDAVFAVHTQAGDYLRTDVIGFGGVPEDRLISSVARDNAPQGGANAGLSEPGILARDLTILVRDGEIDAKEWQSFAQEDPWRAPPDWSPGGESDGASGSAWVMAVVLGAFAAGAFAVLWGVVADRLAASRKAALARGPEPVTPTPAEVRAAAERELDAVAGALAARTGTLDPGLRVRVNGSYDTARALLDGLGSDARDLGDLVGALVLAQVARDGVEGPRPAGPWRPCFVDPRHGEGTRSRRVPVADRRLEVPVCAACERAEHLWPLRVAAGPLGRERPWYEHDTVWSRTGYGAFVDDLWQPVAAARSTREVER